MRMIFGVAASMLVSVTAYAETSGDWHSDFGQGVMEYSTKNADGTTLSITAAKHLLRWLQSE